MGKYFIKSPSPLRQKNYYRHQCWHRLYGAQNEAYKCLLVENVANDLCFS